MKRILTYSITQNDLHTSVSIQDYLKDLGYPHTVFVYLRKNMGSVLLNGSCALLKTSLREGDHLTVILEEQNSSKNIIPADIPLSICYEDEDILVLDKPARMPVHPSMGHHESTLANAVAGYFASCGTPCPFRCINRLDRDTTGLTIVAKHMLSAAILNASMTRREISREYLAIVEGSTVDAGTINAPIARKDGSTIEREVNFLRGETAVTHYRKLAEQNGLSLLSLHLDTGRTHQIRVHMSYIGHPLPGDFLYNPDYRYISRQPLHSYGLEFIHPLTGEPLSFTAPLPADMAALVKDPELTSTEGLWDNDF